MKHREVLEQISCVKEFKEEKEEESGMTGQPCGEIKPSEGNQEPREPQRLEEMPELAWQGVPYLFTEEREAEPQDVGAQGQNQRDYMEMIRKLYGVKDLQGYTEEDLAVVKRYFNPLPPVLEEVLNRGDQERLNHGIQLYQQGYINKIIVSDPLHMKRAMLLAEDTGIKAYSSPTPTTMYRSLKTKMPFLAREVFYYIGYQWYRILE